MFVGLKSIARRLERLEVRGETSSILRMTSRTETDKQYDDADNHQDDEQTC